ncbi:MAG: hypothetical protein ACRD23_03160 [Terriglobales bacterium]
MKISYLCLGLVSLLFCAACGNSSGGGVTGFVPQGNFSNASLNGQYVYQVEGFDFGTNLNGVPYREAGVFTANGSGAITSASDDFSEGSSLLSTSSTGTYAISNDGTGNLSFNNALGTIHLAVTLTSASKLYLVEGDTSLNAGGLAEKQDLTAIASAPTGTFVFLEHDLNALQSVASVGAFTVTGGIVSNGNEDVNSGGAFSSLTFTGSFNAPDSATGRGTGTFTDSSPATSSFVYYIVDANNVRFLSGTVGVIGTGRAELQTGTPALSGSYAFGSKGDTSFLSGVNMAGRFTANAGSIAMGARDSVQDGANATNVSFTGTYTQEASGRALVSLSTAANSNLVVWMVNPARGLFLVNDPNTVQDGSLDLQLGSSFSNSTMNGQYGFVMDGFDAGGAKDRVGTLQWDGSGKLTLNEFTNAAGVINVPVILSGNYAVTGNGRVGASISSLSNNLIFYLVSGNDAYIVQNDSGVVINGTISKQQ